SGPAGWVEPAAVRLETRAGRSDNLMNLGDAFGWTRSRSQPPGKNESN
ncbi:hypothetical protein scyTo_0006482, partial [Scyliorhinus torazame]|nr:hypothetical protein [Scyliorhinus torazame]